jgi:arylsulfatase A-like enzyme/Tfp pilus assembly protein PilF
MHLSCSSRGLSFVTRFANASLLLSSVLLGCRGNVDDRDGDPLRAQDPTKDAPSTVAGAPPNLLLVTLDTTRHDRLGCYGYSCADTPAIDSVAARGVLFEEAYSPAPMTLTAHATLLTGVLPPEHGARVNGEHRLADHVPTLAEELSTAGYRTGAFIAAFVLHQRFGLARGFEVYDDDLTGAYEQEVPSGLARYRPGDRVVDSALQWLRDRPSDQPFFAWVHLYDAHYPWFSHDPAEDSPRPGSGTYDGELAFVDDQVERLLAYLDSEQLTDNTLVALIADHGEGLCDHVELEHAYLLNEEVLHVPWVMAGPGIVAGHRVPALVSLEDFLPTIQHLLGVEASEVRGRSLLVALQGGSVEPGVAYAETDLPFSAFRWSPQRSLTTERWKYIRTPQPELYDRTRDRAELINLVEVEPEVQARLEAQLSALEQETGEVGSEAALLSGEEIEQLAALGYTVGQGDPSQAQGTLADMKERLPAKKLAAALREGLAKENLDDQQVMSMARELVAMSPETPSFHEDLGHALLRVGDVEAGIRELQQAVDLDPDHALSRFSLGDALQQHGLTARARKHLQKALELDPHLAAAQVGMGNVLRAEGRPDLAAGRYAKALELRSGNYPEAHFNLALTFLDRGKPAAAEQAFRSAIEQKPGWGAAHAALADLYANWGKAAEAIEQYQAALALAPNDAGLSLNLGRVLLAVDRMDEARQQLLQAASASKDSRPHVALGDLAFERGNSEEAQRHYEEGLRLAPERAEPIARLARFLATCPDPEIADGARAVSLAERAIEVAGALPRLLDTLAAAHAATGDFTQALAVAHRAQQRARQLDDVQLADDVEARLALYALGRRFVATLPSPPNLEPSS